MRQRTILFGSIFTLFCLLLSTFPSIVGYQTLSTHISNKILDTITTVKNKIPPALLNFLQRFYKSGDTWTPGKIIFSAAFKLLLLFLLAVYTYQAYWAIEGTSFSIQWIFALPLLIVLLIGSGLFYLVLGILCLPWIIILLLFAGRI